MHSKYVIVFIVIIIIGGVIRFIQLDERPMHTDEAVHAYKIGNLIENGEYIYDKEEYHGPSLYYFSLVSAWISGKSDYNSLNEKFLRGNVAILGLFVILLFLLLLKYFDWKIILLIAFLFTISPTMVFYNRYLIHETLMIFFTLGSFVVYFLFIQERKIIWLLLSGLFIGLMIATKETWVLHIGVGLVSGLLLFFLFRKKEIKTRIKLFVLPSIYILFIAAATSILLYSSFFQNPQGILDAITTYTTYFDRAAVDMDHIHPWYYYLNILTINRGFYGFISAEFFVFILGIVGIVLVNKNAKISRPTQLFILFTGIFSLLLFIIYSIIPYKTPWNILVCFGLLFIPAGYALYKVPSFVQKKSARVAFYIFLIVCIAYLGFSTYQYNFRLYCSQKNPHIYAHPTKDIYTIVNTVNKISNQIKDEKNLYIEVIFPNHEYWPLPWYFRDNKNIGWWSEVDTSVAAAPIVISSSEVEGDLLKKWYEIPPPGERHMYLPLIETKLEIRHHVEMRAYIRKDLWDRIDFSSQ